MPDQAHLTDEDRILLIVANYRTPQPARIIAADLDNTTVAEVIANGRSAEVATICRNLISARLMFKDYPYSVRYVAYGLTPHGCARAALLRPAQAA